MERGVHLLVVDADASGRTETVTTLESVSPDWAVTAESTIDASLELIGTESVDCVVSAFELEDGTALSLLQRLRQGDSSTPFVLFAGQMAEKTLGMLYEREATDYVPDVPGVDATLGHRVEALVSSRRSEVRSGTTDGQELARERERFSDLFSNFPEPTVAYGFQDGETVFKDVNDAFENVFGLREAEIRNDPVNENIVPETQLQESEEIDDQVDDGDMVDRVVRRRAADGTRLFNLRSIPVSAEGEIDGFAVYSDITERKENERQLRRQNERLEEFASIVSHDLRNPLNVAMGHLEIIASQNDSDSVDRLSAALDRMETLIEETLQLAKQGEMVTETEPIQLGTLVEDCWEMVDQAAATFERDGDIRFRGDPSRVKQLFENLFRNAIDHAGEDATIHVVVENSTIAVADNGPGIPPDKRERVFETGHTTSDDGTGFGLAIVEEIVDAHGWDIRVTRSESGGARFEITGFEAVERR